MLGEGENKPAMLSEDENKSIGKSGQRNRKRKQQSGKTAERNRKSAQEGNSKSDQSQAAQEQVSAQVSAGSSESYSTDNTLANADQAGSAALAEELQELQESQEQVSTTITSRESHPRDGTHTDIEEGGLAASADPMPASFQSLAKAYEDYARNSFEQSRLFVEKLASARSLDKVFELQADFMKQACEAFLAETQKIRDIHRGLAKQRLAYLEGVVATMAPVASIQRASSN